MNVHETFRKGIRTLDKEHSVRVGTDPDPDLDQSDLDHSDLDHLNLDHLNLDHSDLNHSDLDHSDLDPGSILIRRRWRRLNTLNAFYM